MKLKCWRDQEDMWNLPAGGRAWKVPTHPVFLRASRRGWHVPGTLQGLRCGWMAGRINECFGVVKTPGISNTVIRLKEIQSQIRMGNKSSLVKGTIRPRKTLHGLYMGLKLFHQQVMDGQGNVALAIRLLLRTFFKLAARLFYQSTLTLHQNERETILQSVFSDTNHSRKQIWKFSIAAIANYHKPSDWEQYRVVLLQFYRWILQHESTGLKLRL